MRLEHQPPKWASQFLKWFCSEELIEEIQGDLEEAYRYRRRDHSKIRSDLWYVLDVIKFFKPYSFEKHSRTKQFLPMMNNYIKVSFRNITKQKFLSLLNVVGLSVGIVTVAMVSLYIHHELTYDRSFPDSEKVYRVINHYRDQVYTCVELPDGRESDLEESTRLSRFLKRQDGVENACHFVPNWNPIGPLAKTYVYVDEREFIWDNFLYTNTGYEFQGVFPQKFILGNPQTAFSHFNTVVLTASTARTFYGKNWKQQDLLSKQIEMDSIHFRIGGIIEDVRGNIHFNFGILVHQEIIPNWASYSYFKTKQGVDGYDIVDKLNQGIEEVFPDYYDDGLAKGIGITPLHDIHFTDGMLYEIKPIANVQYLLTFGVVGLVILFIIWTNYANLSIATYAKRQKELGVRKVMGARGKDVSFQIIIEAIMLALLCFPIVWGLGYLTLPFFNQVLGVSISQEVLLSPINILALFLLLMLTGLISGVYPAIKYGNKSLLKLFTGKLSGSGRAIFQFRRILLTGQFFMLIGLMSLTFIIMQQMNFVLDRDLGYEKEGVIFFDVEGREKYFQMKSSIESIPGVASVGSGLVPGSKMYNQTTYKLRGSEPVMADGTHIYTSLSGLELIGIQSDAFSLLKEGQEGIFIINRTAAEKLAKVKGISPEELVGEVIVLEPEWENEDWGYGIHYGIDGIVDNFDYFSLKHESQSLFIEVYKDPDWVYNMLLKLDTKNWVETISKIEDAYLEVEKDIPFQFTFLGDRLNALYDKERNSGRLATSLTIICVILSIMGLIGVVGFIAQAKQKEIGIRKTFGATIRSILLLISKEYVVMILIASMLAIPASLFLADRWLDSFAYRISPDFLTVIYAGFITLLIVIIVVVTQSYRSADLNPSESLRYE